MNEPRSAARPLAVRNADGTVREHLADWLWSEQSLRPSTHTSYETHVRRYLTPHLGRLQLDQLRPAHIERMYRLLSTEEKRGICRWRRCVAYTRR